MPVARKTQRPRQSQVLEAATDLFIAHGYDKTSTDMIAVAAGVARQTIYNQFGSKKGLFLEITKGLADEVTASIAEPQDVGKRIRQTLERFCEDFLRVLIAPRTLAIYRLVISEVLRFPSLGQTIYEVGVTRTKHGVATFLSAQSALHVPDAQLAARQLLVLTTHHLHLLAELGVDAAPSARHIRKEVAEGVAAFLAIYGRPRA